MPGNGPKTTPSAITLKAGSSGMLTDAGRLAEQYAAFRQAQVAVSAVPPHVSPSVVKPTNARIRSARQQAALGVRLAREGRFELAIERLRQAAELDPTVASVHHDLGLAFIHAGRPEEAVVALTRAVRIDQGLTSGHMHLASTLEALARDGEAQAAYEALVRLDPTLHQAHAAIGKLHLKSGRGARAEVAFRAAAAASVPGSARALIYLSHAAMMRGNTKEAETLLRSVIADDPSGGEAYIILGQILAEAGQSSEAAENFERGIALDPDMVAAWHHFAVSTKFTARQMDYVTRMEASLQRPDLSSSQRQSIHFALGKAYDDLRNYPEAMRHLDVANRFRSANRPLDRALLERQTSHAIASAPPGFLDWRRDIGVDDATPILIVGMPRSGTTLVEQILSSHPDIAAGGELGFWRELNRKGLAIFGEDAAAEPAHRLAKDYLAVLRLISPSASRVTDKMPFNFAHLGVIRQLFPRATIVHCRRHPIDTCLSNFATNFQIPFDYAGDRGSLVFFYRQYERLMAHWRDVLPSERFIEVDYEMLVTDPEPLSRRMIEICGLEWNDACLSPQQNQRSIGTASLWQARQPIYRTSIERWRRYEPWLGELRTLLPDGADELLAK
jgi:tetratricopeptide (TPR) repeat protein